MARADGHSLPLAAGEVDATFAEQGVKTVRHVVDTVQHETVGCRLPDIRFRPAWLEDRDVLADGGGEKEGSWETRPIPLRNVSSV